MSDVLLYFTSRRCLCTCLPDSPLASISKLDYIKSLFCLRFLFRRLSTLAVLLHINFCAQSQVDDYIL
jgi:hypothetical protein